MTSKSNFPTKRNLASFPRELTSLIFQNLQHADKLSVRQSCTRLQSHIDDHFRRKLARWMGNEAETLHGDILLLATEQYVSMGFTPPTIEPLIALTEEIASVSSDPWHDIKVPMVIQEREKLLRAFYEEANGRFSEVERKMLFTLTLLQMVRALSPTPPTPVHPFNRKASLRLSFKIPNLFFAIPFYQFVFDWFRFECEWIDILLLVVKFLEMRAARLRNENVAWTRVIRPMVFAHASIIFGSANAFCKGRKKRTTSSTTCTVLMSATRDMIEEMKAFVSTGKFDYAKTADAFDVTFEFACPDMKDSGLRSMFLIKIHHARHPSS